MGWLDGRVAIITGGARGIGREHALAFAAEGARVVVNDVGAGPDGTSPRSDPAAQVVEEIRSMGGEAVASTDDVAEWAGARKVIGTAIDAFGELHVLVNNAGILRDRSVVNMTEEEWDSVVSVHLKGHFATLRHASEYWRDQFKEGKRMAPSVINTSSTSGLFGNPGQSNYGAAKAGIAALTVIAAGELARYGVRVNAIAPTARTRLTEAAPGLGEMVAPPADPGRFDEWDPANVSPLVVWLASEGCPATGQVYYLFGGTIAPMTGWTRTPGVTRPDRWSVTDIDEALRPLL